MTKLLFILCNCHERQLGFYSIGQKVVSVVYICKQTWLKKMLNSHLQTTFETISVHELSNK